MKTYNPTRKNNMDISAKGYLPMNAPRVISRTKAPFYKQKFIPKLTLINSPLYYYAEKLVNDNVITESESHTLKALISLNHKEMPILDDVKASRDKSVKRDRRDKAVGIRTIQNHIAKLMGANIISVERTRVNKKRRNIFTLNFIEDAQALYSKPVSDVSQSYPSEMVSHTYIHSNTNIDLKEEIDLSVHEDSANKVIGTADYFSVIRLHSGQQIKNYKKEKGYYAILAENNLLRVQFYLLFRTNGVKAPAAYRFASTYKVDALQEAIKVTNEKSGSNWGGYLDKVLKQYDKTGRIGNIQDTSHHAYKERGMQQIKTTPPVTIRPTEPARVTPPPRPSIPEDAILAQRQEQYEQYMASYERQPSRYSTPAPVKPISTPIPQALIDTAREEKGADKSGANPLSIDSQEFKRKYENTIPSRYAKEFAEMRSQVATGQTIAATPDAPLQKKRTLPESYLATKSQPRHDPIDSPKTESQSHTGTNSNTHSNNATKE